MSAPNPGSHELLATDIDNPLVRELVDIVLKEATRLARSSTEFTAKDLIKAAKFYVPGELPRLNSRKVNPWNLAVKLERNHCPPEFLAVTAGAGHGGRPALTGRYPKWLKRRWDSEPELKAKYQKMADSMYGKSGGDKSYVGNRPAANVSGDSADVMEDRDQEDCDSEDNRNEPTYAPEIAGGDLEVSADKHSRIESLKSAQSKSLRMLDKLVRTSY